MSESGQVSPPVVLAPRKEQDVLLPCVVQRMVQCPLWGGAVAEEMRVPGHRPTACSSLSLGRGEGRNPAQVLTVFCKIFLILRCPLIGSVNDVFLCASKQLLGVFGL